MTLLIAAVPAFLAALVEFVEALTIVLAIGVTRSWRAALVGAGAAALGLAVVVAAAGPAIARVDPAVYQVLIGSMLLLFGVRWLRKAILRSAGLIPLHDEEAAFASQTAAFRLLPRAGGFDVAGALISFKATALEGLEVVFIVLALGAKGSHQLTAAVLGAALALLVVLGLGVVLRYPIGRLPENAVKFVVGGMLCSFGMFWAGEGFGVRWPGADLSILVLLAGTAALSVLAVRVLRAGEAVPA
jgi:uncharacterized membrane protein